MSIVEGGAKLDWEVFIKRRGSATQGMPPGKEDLAWVTNAVTLVSGNRDALLVDTFLSEEHNSELANWIAAKDKHLALIYVTHGHPDHFFGLKILKERFPEARILARSNVVEAMRRAIEPEALENWRRRWPNQIAKDLILADELDTDLFKLEGRDCRIIDTGHTDTDNTTALHIPSIGLVVSGDAVYNETHPYLGETSGEGYGGWLRALDKIEALDPRAVVAGHGPLHQDCSPSHIAKTRLYIETFVAISKTTSSPLELYERMLQMYPDRINPGSLWAGAHKAKALGVMEPGLQHYEIASAADENAIARRESAPTWEVLG
jgi:glyoxylase-like metal-dependent hydrolase (beta-lactamase superfamily II)